MSIKWKTIEKVSQETGLTKNSLYALKKKGCLREKTHWVKAPNGRIFFDSISLQAWIEGDAA